jgi:hypothetical protein
LLSYLSTDASFLLDLSLGPNAQLHDDLKLLRSVIPSVVVASPVGREVVVLRMYAARAVRSYVISVPAAYDFTATYVTVAIRLSQDHSTLGGAEGLSSNRACRLHFALQTPPLTPQASK